MRLHSLEVTAFGPFAATETVDFDSLGADGLFLLHGQTGAGKTTILDAVAFALYGTVPGARKEGKRLLSDHAAPGAVPTVTLEATVAGRRVRIVRSPEFFRAKKRGTGTTKQNAKASLTWLDGTGQNLTRIDEIGDAVNAALGMSADQFFQVVLLPQGEFARFLRADSDERGNLLERLFDTSRFGDVEEWFADARRSSAATLESRRIAVDKLCGQIATASGEAEQLDHDPVEWATDVLARSRSALAESRITLEAARTRSDSDAAELRRLETLEVLQKRRSVAVQQLSSIEATAPERADLRRRIERSTAAGPVAAMASQSRDTQGRARNAARTVQRIHDAFAELDGSDAVLTQLSASRADTVSDRGVVARAVRAWTTEVAQLEELRALGRRADGEETKARSIDAEIVGVEKSTAALIAQRADLPAAIEAVEASVQSAVRSAAEIPVLEQNSARLADSVEAAIELAQVCKKKAAADKAHETARAAHNDAREHTLDLRARRLSGMATELAARLVDGQPCEVCGSHTHPAPALPAESVVTKDDEDRASELERRAGALVETTARELAELVRTADVLSTRAGDLDSAELAVALDAATAALSTARADAAALDSARNRVAQLRTEEQRLGAVISDEHATVARLQAQLAQARASAQEMRARIHDAVDGEESIEHRIDRLEKLIAQSAELVDRRIDAADAEANAATVAEQLTELIETSGFGSADEAAQHVLTPQRVGVIEQQLTEASDLEAHARRVLAEPAIADVAGTEPVDLVPAKEAVARSASQLHDAVAEHAGCKRRTEQVEELAAQLWAVVDKTAPMQAKHDELAALADVVAGRGQNARKMSLRSYVLASRLEDVAESASARLRRMSSGRYEFVHSDEAESRGRRGGLGLDIRDDYTGVVRSAKTLSGGESFLASLALALGLADVVAAESGGVVLDTIFIDEGFGTLDPETLESVMGVLDDLRAGGRVVGIVSHVDEMRQRIPSRLHVKRARHGSTLELVATSS